jgi:hypothetical protein
VTRRKVGVAGILFAVLAAAAIALMHQYPSPSSTDAQVTAWFADGGNVTQAVLGVHLSAFATMTFLWFVAAIRARIGETVEPLLGMVFIASGVLVAACAVAATAAWGGIAIAIEYLDWNAAASAETAGATRGFAYVSGVVFGCRMAAMFVLATSTIALRTGVLPRWLAFVGYAVGLVLFLAVPKLEITVALFPLWVCLLSIEILRRGTRLPDPPEQDDAEAAPAP